METKRLLLILTTPLLVAAFFIPPAPVQEYRYGFEGYRPALKSSARITHNGTRIICFNQTIPQLFSVALCDGGTIEVKRSMFNENVKELFDIKYCYELVVPEKMKEDIYKIMQKNLKDKFPKLKASIVKMSNEEYLKIENTKGALITPIKR